MRRPGRKAVIALGALVALALVLTAYGARTGATEDTADAGRLGPLRSLSSNRRYFTDGSGRAVYLTGSHVWWNLVGPPTWVVDCDSRFRAPFDYEQYLDWLVRHRHNFIRLWRIEFSAWSECGEVVKIGLHPWRRTGPGTAADGLPKFDLRRFDPAYFRRLRGRVVAAGRRGLYVSIMLFEGWGAQYFEPPWKAIGHPFHASNNVNGVGADANGDGSILEIYTLSTPRIRRLQEAYVRKVVDTVSDLDNVLFEIANESGAFSTDWQYRMIDVVKRYEARKQRKRHPVGMTFQHHDLRGEALFRSRADWISPHDPEGVTDPAPAAASKVILWDTDHHCGVCGDAAAVWKAFTRGYNPIFMDPMTDRRELQEARQAMGHTRSYAERIRLGSTAPRGDLCSTGYCLVAPGREYLVYQSTGGPFSVDLGAAHGRELAVEWMHPVTGAISPAAPVTGGAHAQFTPPFEGPAVLYLRRM